MRTPSPTESTERLRQLSIYTEAQLGADAQAKDLVQPLQQARAELETAEKARQTAEDAATAQMALRDGSDRAADDTVRDFYLDVRAADGKGGGKAGPLQKSYLPNGLSGITHRPVAAQIAAMRVLAGKLIGTADAALAAHGPGIASAADALEQSAEGYEVAVQGVGIAYGQVVVARTAWIRIYEKTYGELIARVGKRAAEAFFKAPKKLPTPPKV